MKIDGSENKHRDKALIPLLLAAVLMVTLPAAALTVMLPAMSCRAFAAETASVGAAVGGVEAEPVISLLYKYDSTDRAVVRSVSPAQGTVTLCQHDLGRYYTLGADNTSMVYDRHGRPISTSLLKPGDVVDATFLHQSKHLNSLVVSEAAWVKEEVRNYRIVPEQELISIDGQNFHLPNTALLLSEENGTTRRIIAEELLEGDVLKVSGVEKEIYSIVVTGGHGYLRLTGTEVSGTDIEGAWLNLDNRVIQRVNDKLLVAAPEGDYTLQIIGQGANDERQITIERGKETVIDTTTIKLESPEETEVTFLVEPEEAEPTLEVDGEPVKIGLPTCLTVGVHRLRLKADGYLTQTQYLNVGGKKHATVTLELEKDPDYSADAATTASTANTSNSADTADTADTANTANTASTGASGATTGATLLVDASGNTISVTGATDAANAAAGTSTVTIIDVSGNETQRTTMPGYEIRVEAPSNTEFYLDDNYMGIVPCTFVKTTGQHTVTLRREGYETRSYNIFIDNAQSDKNYIFPELTRVEE